MSLFNEKQSIHEAVTTFVFIGGAKEAYDSLISGITTGPMKRDWWYVVEVEEDEEDEEEDKSDFEDKWDESVYAAWVGRTVITSIYGPIFVDMNESRSNSLHFTLLLFLIDS